jgi:zinc/manganese transport system substrate-binding protein
MQKLLFVLLVTLSMVMSAAPAQAALNVFACEPEWGALAQELGGDKVSVYNATQALQDPHHVQAKPSLIAKARSANLVVCTGMELEIGWLPMVLRQASNAEVQPSRPGYFEAGNYVKHLEIPQRLDRADGDVHAQGNPHIQTDPRNIAKVGDALVQRLMELDPANSAFYRARHQDFSQRWQEAIKRWETQAVPLKGIAIVAQHNGFPYMNEWLGLRQVATLEPKTGVEPTSSHLAEVLALLQREPAKMVIRAAYNDDRASIWLSERAKIPAVVLPFTVGGADHANDLFSLFEVTISRLIDAIATDKIK